MGGIVHAVLAGRAADDVVVEIGFHLPALRSGIFRQQLAAIKPLLLAREHGEHQGRREFVLRQNARGFHHRGHARAVIVGARRIGCRVHHIGHAAVEMPGNDDDPVGIRCALLHRQHIHDLGRCLDARSRHHVGRRRHTDAAAAFLRDGFEARFHPAPRRADAARVGCGVGERVPRAEADEFVDTGFQVVRLHIGRDGLQQRLRRRRHGRRRHGMGGRCIGGNPGGNRQHPGQHNSSNGYGSTAHGFPLEIGSRQRLARAAQRSNPQAVARDYRGVIEISLSSPARHARQRPPSLSSPARIMRVSACAEVKGTQGATTSSISMNARRSHSAGAEPMSPPGSP